MCQHELLEINLYLKNLQNKISNYTRLQNILAALQTHLRKEKSSKFDRIHIFCRRRIWSEYNDVAEIQKEVCLYSFNGTYIAGPIIVKSATNVSSRELIIVT